MDLHTPDRPYSVRESGNCGKVYEEALKRVGEDQFVVDLVGLENQDIFLGNYEGIYW